MFVSLLQQSLSFRKQTAVPFHYDIRLFVRPGLR